MKAIIAVNNLGYIGKDNTLMWRCSEDLKYFKSMTINCSLLVGHNTALELPPLKNRTVVVDVRDGYNLDCDWCIGGKKTYEKYAKFFTEIHISHINDNTIGDTMFPNLSELNSDCKIYNNYYEVN